jgi:hypothetical protein
MSWRIVVLLTIALAAGGVYVLGPQISPVLREESARINAVWSILVAGLALGWVRGLRGVRLPTALRYGLIWATIIAALTLAYRFRNSIGP